MKAERYQEDLLNGAVAPGLFLEEAMSAGRPIDSYTTLDFLRMLLSTKRPCIYAESDAFLDGSDWNSLEMEILGDISVACRSTIFDDGTHINPSVHLEPFRSTLLFTPGALIRTKLDNSPDKHEITDGLRLNCEMFYELYRRRLAPVFKYANDQAKSRGIRALITVPGLGCGQFAGSFKGTLGVELERALVVLLEGGHYDSIETVIYDPYDESKDSDRVVNGVRFVTAPFSRSSKPTAQLAHPKTLNKMVADVNSVMHFSVVAWDHLSWPGNDFYQGNRATDDGVKGAASDLMRQMTGVAGSYCDHLNQYLPPKPYKNWDAVVRERHLVFGKGAVVDVY